MADEPASVGSSTSVPSEPYDVGGGVILGRVAWVRNESHLQVGIWEVTRAEAVATQGEDPSPYTFSGDETLMVLEGEVEVEIVGGERVNLRPGDVASFRKGATSRWRFKSETFKEVFIYSGLQ
jgi:uncharacterized cupin superfamily protein